MAAMRFSLVALTAIGATMAFLASTAAASAQTTTYSYDVFGRLSSVSTAGGAQTSYTYDAADNRSQVVKTNGVQVIGAAKHREGRRWIHFALGRRGHPAAVKSGTVVTAIAAPAGVEATPGTPEKAGRIALAIAGVGR